MDAIELTVTVKNRLRLRMAEAGFRNIRVLASESGLHPNTLYKLDRGEDAAISLESIVKLLWTLGCSFEELFEFEVSSNEPESFNDLADDLQEEIRQARQERKQPSRKPIKPRKQTAAEKKRLASG